MTRILILSLCLYIPISLPKVVGQESDTTTSKGTLDARRPKLRLEDSKSDVKAAKPKKESKGCFKTVAALARVRTFARKSRVLANAATTDSGFETASKDKLKEAWIGKLNIGVIKPVMQFRIVTLKSGKTTAFFDSITEGRTGFEATWSVDGDMLKFDVAKIKLRFRGTLNKKRDTAEGTWSQGGRKLPLTLKKQATEYDKAAHVWPEQTKGTLSSAVEGGDLDRVKLLIENGADPIAMDRNGVTPFQLATIRGYGKIADYLVAKGASRSPAIPSGDELTDRLLRRIVKKHSPGVAVLVSKDGKVLFKKSYGLADRENGRKVQPDTKFRIGSVTKQFTAAAILKLQEQGKLSVNDKLSRHLPDFPRGDDVRLRHLLTHTSGIPSHTSKPDFMRKVVSPVKPEQVIDTFKNDRFDFEPGEKHIYRNSNYFLLGHIASKVSGKSLDAFLQSEFFKPLGMKNTGVYRNDAPPDGEALGYSYEGGGLKHAINWDMSWAGGAGALYSTVGDLNRWNEALFAGKVLNQSTLESAFAGATTSDGKETNYGYGWKIASVKE